MDAARLKRARRRIRQYVFGTGVILAVLYLLAAAFLIRIVGVELTEYWTTVLLAAGVMLGGTYALTMLVYLIVHVARRLINRQPVLEIED